MIGTLAASISRRRLPHWRAPGLRLATLGIIALFVAPAAAVIGGAIWGESAGQTLSHAALLVYLSQTFMYVGGSVLLACVMALPAAWLTVMINFPGQRILVWALFMPLALPPYVTGYAYAHFFDDVMGFSIRGLTGACAVTAMAIYPYIYLFARAALKQQSRNIQSAARLMGHSAWSTCYRVSWPLARPAVAVGVSLALMETLNDIAIAEHYGVRAIGLAVYDIWLNRGDLYAACRLAVVLMLLVAGLLMLEEQGRKKQRQYASLCDRRFACEQTVKLRGWRGILCALVLFLPAAGGFVLPLGWFAVLTLRTEPELWRVSFVDGLGGSLLLASITAAGLMVAATMFALDKRQNGRGPWLAGVAKFSQMGYALPGTVLAQGFFILSLVVSSWAGYSLLTAGLTLVVTACMTRFFIIAAGALETGMAHISPQLDAAARLSGIGTGRIFWRIHLPLLRPSAAIALLLIFLEGVKELPMTLILRPFDFHTLATVIFQYASDEALELAAPAVLAMAAICGAAVCLLFRLEGRDWHG